VSLEPAPTHPFSLAGRRVLVTGASSGIGKQIALSCAAMGAELVITGRDEARLAASLQSLPGSGHRSVIADLTVAAQREQLVDGLDAVDGVVHSAGISRLAPLRQVSSAHLNEVWQVNYEAPILLTQRMLAKSLVKPDGSIVFISSIAAFIGVAGVGAYSGTKAALIATMRCLSMEVVKRRIRVNCLAPALVESPLLEATAGIVGSLDEERKAYPLGFGKPEDVANAAVFYLAPASRWITGTTLVMDGGLTVR
jgi:NAD(P)-dependent dehydrogenase (short-subunit alcohol dehydrogenase family)